MTFLGIKHIIQFIMAEYLGPSLEKDYYSSKFVRVTDNLYVTLAGDINTQHSVLAHEHNLLQRINQLRTSSPEEIDAGFITVSNTLQLIVVNLGSMILNLPAVVDARKRTIEVVLSKTPGYKVISPKLAL